MATLSCLDYTEFIHEAFSGDIFKTDLK